MSGFLGGLVGSIAVSALGGLFGRKKAKKQSEAQKRLLEAQRNLNLLLVGQEEARTGEKERLGQIALRERGFGTGRIPLIGTGPSTLQAGDLSRFQTEIQRARDVFAARRRVIEAGGAFEREQLKTPSIKEIFAQAGIAFLPLAAQQLFSSEPLFEPEPAPFKYKPYVYGGA